MSKQGLLNLGGGRHSNKYSSICATIVILQKVTKILGVAVNWKSSVTDFVK